MSEQKPSGSMSLSRRHLLKGGAAALAAAGLPGAFGVLQASPAAAAHLRSATKPVTQSGFAPLVNTRFRIRTGILPVDLQLKAVQPGTKPSPSGEAFSLVFDGPASKRLRQGTYTVTHPSLGAFPLFLVPGRNSTSGQSYEAVFNRL